jgi:hypothetical protein
MGFRAPTAHSSKEDPVLPGVPPPSTFRPQGLITLPAASSPPSLATARRPPQRPWGSPFRVLHLPASGTPLGASPLLSFIQSARRRVAATPEVDSDGEGARLASARRPRRPNLALLGLRPSKAFSSTTLGPASRSWPLLPFGRRCSLRSTSGRDSRGCSVAEAALSLSRLPAFLGFGTSSITGPLRETCAPGLWLRLGLRTLASGGLLGAPDLPDRSSAPRRVGATNRSRHPTPTSCQTSRSRFRLPYRRG